MVLHGIFWLLSLVAMHDCCVWLTLTETGQVQPRPGPTILAIGFLTLIAPLAILDFARHCAGFLATLDL